MNEGLQHLDEFRAPAPVRALAEALARVSAEPPRGRPWRVMEFCGGHTHAFFRFGLMDLLPKGLELIHGPGCPVCLLPPECIDQAVTLAHVPGVRVACFGDVLRVPGQRGSLAQARAAGGTVHPVYSPLDALALARRHPDEEVVFLALGFETTQPATALTLLAAQREGRDNFTVLLHHVTTPAVLAALLEDPSLEVDAFIAPGHVAGITGEGAFRFVAEHHHRPIVISGFEPLDLLQSLLLVGRQLTAGEARLENQYRRVVRHQGSPRGQEAVAKVFQPAPVTLRGLGVLPNGGLRLRPSFASFDALARHGGSPPLQTVPEPAPCAQILTGARSPTACPHFDRECTPTHPLGAPMVSGEGACAAHYRYRRPA